MLESQTSLAGELLEKNDASDNNARMTQEIGHVLTRQDSVPDVVREVAAYSKSGSTMTGALYSLRTKKRVLSNRRASLGIRKRTSRC